MVINIQLWGGVLAHRKYVRTKGVSPIQTRTRGGWGSKKPEIFAWMDPHINSPSWVCHNCSMVCLCMDISCNSIPFLYSLNMDQDALSACTLRGLRWGSLFLCNTETKSSLTQNWLELSMKSYLTILIYILKATNYLKLYFHKSVK